MCAIMKRSTLRQAQPSSHKETRDLADIFIDADTNEGVDPCAVNA